MGDRKLAEKLLSDHFLVAAALIDLQFHHLPDAVRARTMEAIAAGTGILELRTRVGCSETELVLVSSDGSELLCLARTPPR